MLTCWRDFILHHDRRQGGNTDILTCEQAHHRHVVGFGDDMRPDIELAGQSIETGANAGSASRDDDRVRHQALGKAAFITEARRGSDQAHRTFREPMIG